MRDIKIRAWDKIQKEMVFDGIDYEIKMLNLPPLDEARDSQIGFMEEDVGRIFELMQFTGLTDRNNDEIYEGDIINTPSDKLLVVKWCNKYASFCLDKKGWIHNHWFGEAVEPENCEIVGNIYENPDIIS